MVRVIEREREGGREVRERDGVRERKRSERKRCMRMRDERERENEISERNNNFSYLRFTVLNIFIICNYSSSPQNIINHDYPILVQQLQAPLYIMLISTLVGINKHKIKGSFQLLSV